MNSVSLVGRLTADPDIRYANNGEELCIASFSIAINRNKDDVDFFNVTAFRSTAEFIEKYFRKGMRVGVEGRLQQNRYKDKDGNNRSVVQIIANRVEILQSKAENSNASDDGGQWMNFDGDGKPPWEDDNSNKPPVKAKSSTSGRRK